MARTRSTTLSGFIRMLMADAWKQFDEEENPKTKKGV
jgi:hypothetical protein